jgi:hypothetical protein
MLIGHLACRRASSQKFKIAGFKFLGLAAIASDATGVV